MADHWGDEDTGGVRVLDREKEKQREKVRPPKQFHVVMLNDDFTTMDFVVDVLKMYFGKSNSEAGRIMLTVHTQGKAIAGTYSKDVAETKAKIANDHAQGHDHPFLCTTEEVPE